MTTNTLPNNQLSQLRTDNVITENEVALLEGDLLIAKNVVTQERRIIGKASDILNESTDNKRILKG
tara:strand:- start:505 stop:702 length:198 start_codon:yes stop_codon:yes gene_type:complete